VNIVSRRLVKPIYRGQPFFLLLLKEQNWSLTATEFQKLLFLFFTKNNIPYYGFVFYLDDDFIIQESEDIISLQAISWLEDTNGKISKVRDNQLIKLVYEQYLYFALKVIQQHL
jgi:hypothetical protein